MVFFLYETKTILELSKLKVGHNNFIHHYYFFLDPDDSDNSTLKLSDSDEETEV